MSCKLEVELLAARSRLRDAPSPAGPADRAKAGMGLQSERPDVICMRAALEQFDGPILSLADERTRIQSQWSKIVAAWGHPRLRELFRRRPESVCSSVARAAMSVRRRNFAFMRKWGCHGSQRVA